VSEKVPDFLTPFSLPIAAGPATDPYRWADITEGAAKPMSDKPQHPPTIDLDGARLRPLRVAETDALYAYPRDPVVTELTSYPVASLPMVEAMIERCRSRWAAGELSKWGIARQHDDRLVGTCGFNEWSRIHRWAELAYDLAPDHWGKGLMHQAVAAVLQWTYRQDQVNRVHAFVRVDNRRSQRLLERGGFVREGCLRSYRVCRGQPYDFYIYGLLRSDWAAAQQPARADEA
jgi:ribosomal-protein-alanine N-acetyltransferase